MKNILILFVTLAALTSCKNESKQVDTEAVIEDNSSAISEEKAINFGEERKFAGVFYNPGSRTNVFYTDCVDGALFVPLREQAFDDFFKPFKNKNPETYLTTPSVYIEFVGYIAETKEHVKKGEFYNVVLTEILYMDMEKTCN